MRMSLIAFSIRAAATQRFSALRARMVDRAHGRRRGHAAGWFQPLGVRRSANFFSLENTMRFLWSRRRHTKVPGRSRSPRLQVQVLEDRTVPAFLAPLGVDA